MIPDHGVSAQTTLAPYSITASKNTYSPGEKITVTLQGSDPFEGFLLQARKAGGTAAVGTFTITDTANSQGLDCNGPSSSLVLISSTGCGTNKTCFSNPAGCDAATNADCFFMSSASPQGGSDGIQFEISGKSNGYISIGFSDDTEMGAHPVIGCIVMGLALIQPLIAVFRCAPDSKRRIVFNLVHAINALVIKVLAVTLYRMESKFVRLHQWGNRK
ncbi:UNVERIFIED_CONTAM: hypothetical protein FKN15_010408 [Acipenser sinensis]